MGRPRVTVYNEISVDGRVQGFADAHGRYYRLGYRIPTDAIMMGSVTAQAFNLAVALARLHNEHGVRTIRTDGGGRLAGGLVDEVVLLLALRISGLPGARNVFELPSTWAGLSRW